MEDNWEGKKQTQTVFLTWWMLLFMIICDTNQSSEFVANWEILIFIVKFQVNKRKKLCVFKNL